MMLQRDTESLFPPMRTRDENLPPYLRRRDPVPTPFVEELPLLDDPATVRQRTPPHDDRGQPPDPFLRRDAVAAAAHGALLRREMGRRAARHLR